MSIDELGQGLLLSQPDRIVSHPLPLFTWTIAIKEKLLGASAAVSAKKDKNV
jgi:hypothetical protein